MRARIMDTDADFQKLGINPDKVELWEEGRRDTSEPGHNEVWYFDATMEDGTKFMAGFRPIDPAKMATGGDSPNVNIIVTTPAGEEKGDFHYFTAEESYTGEKEGCDLKYGTDTAKGDFKNYDIHIEPTNGVGCDLHYEALVDPFRQGTGIVAFGDHDEYHHTDLSVPKNKVTGTVYYDGKTHEVSGVGYHDHQWMSANPMALYHHWLWGRMYTEQYTVYIYDFVANEKYGFKRLPMFGLLDNKTGELVFETDGQMTLDTKLEEQSQLHRDFPKESHYIFKNEDGREVELSIKWEQEIETRDMYSNAAEPAKKQFDTMNIKPFYMRYYAKGNVVYRQPGKEDQKSSGDMIYEYAYLGKPDPRANV
ncbi:MAG TPA: lipocalin-like domain-containing protein [Tetragenococcus sp.]|nr:lipocalin-like domain-containing protein [Tetragenococcus sp.]